MWVPKIPKREDFCGCPPCGLCFDWVEENPAGEEQGYRTDGMRKITEDLLGKDVTPTPEQKRQIVEGIDRVHVYNLNRSKVTPEQANKDTIDESFTRREVEGFLKQKAKEANAVRPKIDTRPTLDEIADKKEEKKEEVKKEEVVQQPVTQSSRNAAIMKAEARRAAEKEAYMNKMRAYYDPYKDRNW